MLPVNWKAWFVWQWMALVVGLLICLMTTGLGSRQEVQVCTYVN